MASNRSEQLLKQLIEREKSVFVPQKNVCVVYDFSAFLGETL